MNRNQITIILLFGMLLILHQSISQTLSSGYSGTYSMKTEEVELTLELIQLDENTINGTLISSAGFNYSLDGSIQAGVASGICSGKGESVFFEIHVENAELIISLIEPDAWNMPDYTTATYLSFTKKEDQHNTLHENGPLMAVTNDNVEPAYTSKTKNSITNPAWGFQIIPPQGWTHQLSGEAILMGHNSIPGIILLFPHYLKTMKEVKQEMINGIQEDGNYLVLNSDLTKVEENLFEGTYQGIMDGQQAKAHGFGTLSPYSGGAFILAISTPQALGTEIIKDAGWIASNLLYIKPDNDLAMHFTGRWANFTSNTSTWIQFYADGTYDEQYESGYSGELSGGGNWGVAGSENSKGRWSVKGNREQGRITVVLPNGNTIPYDYQVHEEGGVKYYSEYWFNGKLYGKSVD